MTGQYAYSRSSKLLLYILISAKLLMLCRIKNCLKLHLYGIRGALLLWIQNFFTGRTHHTRLGVHVSDVAQLISGVVQGSGIGPLVFLLYVNKLIDSLDNFGVKVKMFADDAKMYLHLMIQMLHDYTKLLMR